MENQIKLIEHLSKFVSEERIKLFEKKINQRTKNISIVLEDIYQARNISAVMRSADFFGIQDLHIIENRNKFISDKKVDLGSEKWLNIIRYEKKENNTKKCLTKLKQNGYQIIATSPHITKNTLENIKIKDKVAILFGTELHGLSKEAIKLSDETIRIKTYGFTESLNISASAAICMYHLRNIINKKISPKTSNKEKQDIMIEWLRNSVKSSKEIEKDFYKNIVKSTKCIKG